MDEAQTDVPTGYGRVYREEPAGGPTGRVSIEYARLSTPDSIRLLLKPLAGSCDHPAERQESCFYHSASIYPVAAIGCSTCNNDHNQSTILNLTATSRLMQVMIMSTMAHAYMQHNNSGDLHRDSLLACLLYVLKQGAPTRPKPISLEELTYVCDEYLAAARKLKPGTVVPPMAACNLRTVEGQHKRWRTNNNCIKIHRPTEK